MKGGKVLMTVQKYHERVMHQALDVIGLLLSRVMDCQIEF